MSANENVTSPGQFLRSSFTYARLVKKIFLLHTHMSHKYIWPTNNIILYFCCCFAHFYSLTCFSLLKVPIIMYTFRIIHWAYYCVIHFNIIIIFLIPIIYNHFALSSFMIKIIIFHNYYYYYYLCISIRC